VAHFLRPTRSKNGLALFHIGLGVIILLICSGCIQTNQHFRGGKLLAPGETGVTVGAGTTKVFKEREPQPRWTIDSGKTVPLALTQTIPQFSLDYRLGLRDRWGPFRGVEIGWHLEAPTNPASAAFDAKLGLPRPRTWKDFDHAVAAGWIIGTYADNGFFAEYATSWSYLAFEGFATQRLHWLSTPPPEAFLNEGELERIEKPVFQTHRRGIWQGMFGIGWTLPPLLLLPDRIAPQISVTAPSWVSNLNTTHLHKTQPFTWQWALGLEWRFE
jgi:hypothetical protein